MSLLMNNLFLISGTKNTMRRKVIAITMTEPITTAKIIIQVVVELSSPFLLLSQFTKRTDIELDSTIKFGQKSVE